jgi:hypothetical protein
MSRRAWSTVGAVALGVGLTFTVLMPSTSPAQTVPDFVSLEPLPESVRHDAQLLQAELDRRLFEWAAKVNVARMTPDELATGIQVIWAQVQSLGETEDWWLDFKQLGARINLLCVNLPSDHALRADFCANS